jgi:hypothetical protein
MSEITELKEMLRQHINDSAEYRTETKSSLAKIEVHHEYTQEKLKVVDKLEAAHNKQKGVLWVLSLLGLGGIEEWIRHFLK